jgi:hypothetical protein
MALIRAKAHALAPSLALQDASCFVAHHVLAVVARIVALVVSRFVVMRRAWARGWSREKVEGGFGWDAGLVPGWSDHRMDPVVAVPPRG